tara:strand:- start:2078 stop:5071 length:2994 start_codon:yes stop_codon:yes gene_type:complete
MKRLVIALLIIFGVFVVFGAVNGIVSGQEHREANKTLDWWHTNFIISKVYPNQGDSAQTDPRFIDLTPALIETVPGTTGDVNLAMHTSMEIEKDGYMVFKNNIRDNGAIYMKTSTGEIKLIMTGRTKYECPNVFLYAACVYSRESKLLYSNRIADHANTAYTTVVNKPGYTETCPDFYWLVNTSTSNPLYYCGSSSGEYKVELKAGDTLYFRGEDSNEPGGTGMEIWGYEDLPPEPPIIHIPITNSCTSEEQIILSLYDINNSHGALWNDDYGYKICYEQIFGEEYTGANPRTCDDLNDVLKLSDVTNAHAEGPAGENYDEDICYGDLRCRLVKTGSCDVDEEVVVYLSDTSNAHLAAPAETDFYTNKICCSRDQGEPLPSGTIGEVYWTDYANGRISESHVNRTVKLVAETGFASGTEIEFNIKESDGLAGDDGDVDVVLTGNADVDGNAIVDWKITDDIMELAENCVLGVCTDGDAEFYFVGMEPLSGEMNTSAELEVYNEEGENTIPQALISSPEHRQIYFTNREIEFVGDCTDVESPPDYGWKIEEEVLPEGKTTMESFKHTFTSAGQKTITLECVDSLDSSLSDEDQVAILVIESPGILSFINNPFHKQVIQHDELVVEFDASDSYVINNNFDGVACTGTIDCLGGECPSLTKNPPVNCVENVTVVGTPKDFSEMLFNWTDGTDENVFGDRFAGLGLVTDEVVYFSPGSEKKINLLVSYENTNLGIDVNEDTSREFTLVDETQCIDGGRAFVTFDAQGNEIERWATEGPAAVNCGGADLIIGGLSDCCPPTFTCADTGTKIECVLDDSGIDRCEQYEDKTTCDDDDYNVGTSENYKNNFREVWESLQCDQTLSDGTKIRCGAEEGGCIWNVTGTPEETEGDCGLKIEEIRDNGPGGGSRPCSECLYHVKVEKLDEEGEVCTFRETKTPLGETHAGFPLCSDADPADCIASEREYSGRCGRAFVELPFFAFGNLIGTLAVISIIYALYLMRKK